MSEIRKGIVARYATRSTSTLEIDKFKLPRIWDFRIELMVALRAAVVVHAFERAVVASLATHGLIL
jgi:hypothetical protein